MILLVVDNSLSFLLLGSEPLDFAVESHVKQMAS